VGWSFGAGNHIHKRQTYFENGNCLKQFCLSWSSLSIQPEFGVLYWYQFINICLCWMLGAVFLSFENAFHLADFPFRHMN